jgi:hypothetical protein
MEQDYLLVNYLLVVGQKSMTGFKTGRPRLGVPDWASAIIFIVGSASPTNG